MKTSIKNRIILFSVLIALVFSISNSKYNKISGEIKTNSFKTDTEDRVIDQTEIKTSGDNNYKKVWYYDGGWADIRDVCVDDIDVDGNKEIIATASGGLVVLEYNKTTNDYVIEWQSGSLITGSIYEICTGDHDGDGKKEIMGGGSNYKLSIVECDGTNYEKVYEKDLAPMQFYSIEDIVMGDDCDKDGVNEIIFTQYESSSRVRVFEFNGTDNGCEETWYSDKLGGSDSVCSTNDLDWDGKKEIVTSSGYNLIVFENIANNSFIKVWNSTNKINSPINSICTNDDLDEDGKKEIIVGVGGLGKYNGTYIFEYNGIRGNDGYEEVWNSSTTIIYPVYSVCIGNDLDGDDKKEIIVGSDKLTSPFRWIVNIFEYNGIDNGFNKVWDSGTTMSSYINKICIGDDLNRNGKDEIIVGTDSGEIYIFEHDDTVSSTFIVEEDDDDDDEEEKEGILSISNQTLFIGGGIAAAVITGLVIILIKKKGSSGR